MTGARRARSSPPAGSGPGAAKERALGLLAVRWRSRAELERRLGRAGFTETDVAVALDDLASAGLVDDERFAREVVKVEAGRRLSGGRAIRDALRRAGVAPEVAEDALRDAERESGDEADRALELARRRARRLRTQPPDVAVRRLYDHLRRHGYDPETAGEAARRAVEAPEEGLEGLQRPVSRRRL